MPRRQYRPLEDLVWCSAHGEVHDPLSQEHEGQCDSSSWRAVYVLMAEDEEF